MIGREALRTRAQVGVPAAAGVRPDRRIRWIQRRAGESARRGVMEYVFDLV